MWPPLSPVGSRRPIGPTRRSPVPAPALKLPAIQKRQLSNGLPVWIVELHEVPVAQVNLVVLSGSADDPAGKFGVASLTAAMLDEGAGSRSALEIADAVDFLGADLVANTGSDGSAVRLHVPVARLAEALPIMADVALRPTFPNDELLRLRAQRLTTVIQARDDPETIAQLAFARVLSGRRTVTARRQGTAQNDQVAHRQTTCAPSTRRRSSRTTRRCSWSATSRRTRRCRCSKRASAGGRRTGRRPSMRRSRRPPCRPPSQIYLVDKPGAPQSQIRIGWVGVPRSTPDFFPSR